MKATMSVHGKDISVNLDFTFRERIKIFFGGKIKAESEVIIRNAEFDEEMVLITKEEYDLYEQLVIRIKKKVNEMKGIVEKQGDEHTAE